jgi:hypothetical protein
MFKKLADQMAELVETAREDLRVKSPEQLKAMEKDDHTGLVAQELRNRGER